jgi:signal transduction histidine kinase
MISHCHAPGRSGKRFFAAMLLLLAAGFPAWSQAITNLQQLTRTLAGERRIYRAVRLEGVVCAASRPELGVIIVQDDSGVELLQVGDFGRNISPGEKVRIEGDNCLLRRRDIGVEISPAPAVDNDGVHIHWTIQGAVTLKAGQNPVRVEWFNNLREFNLELTAPEPDSVPLPVAASNFWHGVVDQTSGQTNYLPGLFAECYEGRWETVPNFDLLEPVKTGTVANLDLGFRERDEMTGIRFTGFFNAPRDGEYLFRLRSDDGSLLFFGNPEVPVVSAGNTNVPMAAALNLGAPLAGLSERSWVTVDGRAGFVTRTGRGVEFELRSDRDVILVRVADAEGLDVSRLQNARVSVTGVGRGVLTASRYIVLGAVFAANAENVKFLETGTKNQPALPIRSVAEVQSLPLEEARRALPVRVRGVVTDSKEAIYERLMSIQDDTRGIFVVVDSLAIGLPGVGEYVEVQGHSGAGDFAPVIIAEKITSLGAGRVPEPVEPTWTELLNGSMDVQWAEIQGLVTGVQSNTLSLLLPEGQMDVEMDGYDRADLEPYEKSVVRIRGVLYAMWNAATREVRVGSVKMRNAAISVEVAAPADPFNTVVKTPRELLLFDSQASAFRRVKVRGQIVYADESQLFLEDDGVGLRVLPAGKNDLRAGDLVEAVGYPDISRTALLLRNAKIRKTGHAPLPAPKILSESGLAQNYLDATLVRMEGKLLGWHVEQGAGVLEMQSGQNLYLARLSPQAVRPVSLRAGSRLELTGVYVGHVRGLEQRAEAQAFALLLNSPDDIVIRSQPSWWTLQRLMILIGGLLVVLVFAAAWIKQLRRLVEQRTNQLRVEIHERERIEHQHALEAERSRIARDLHDDLGSSLTEISVLASTGQRPSLAEGSHTGLFRSIAGKARQLISALDVIVWAVDPEDNSLQSFADYVTGHTEDFFSNTDIACRFKVPVSFPPVTLEGRVRHDLLMAVKEALNNIVRHAEATEVEFHMAVAEGRLAIDIADNGKGFEPGTGGHGLKNLPARLVKLGGTCVVESRVGGGTTVRIRLPLTASAGETASRADTTFD